MNYRISIAKEYAIDKLYSNTDSKNKLKRWFDEKWVDIKTGKPCGRSNSRNSSREYPACRPSIRINEDTPKTSKELSREEVAKFINTKKSKNRIPYSHKKETINKSKVSYNKNIPEEKLLYNKVVEDAKRRFNKWPSAYASGWVVKEYKRLGGTYKTKNS